MLQEYLKVVFVGVLIAERIEKSENSKMKCKSRACPSPVERGWGEALRMKIKIQIICLFAIYNGNDYTKIKCSKIILNPRGGN